MPPVLVGELEQGSAPARAGVVDEHVDAAECVGKIVDYIRGNREIGQVEPPNLSPTAVASYLLSGFASARLVLVPRDAHVEAVDGQAHGCRPAYARVRAGDDGYRHVGNISAAPRR
jgi:hypothetical protein